jgi:hypothetical protein
VETLVDKFVAGARRLNAAMGRFRRAIARLDWPVIVIVGCFALAMPWQPLLTAVFPWISWKPAGPYAPYEQALHDASIKTPNDQKVLRRIEGTTAQFVSFRATPLPAGPLTLTGPLWVALPDELRSACNGADDVVIRLQHVLGLPPRAGNFQLYSVTAPVSQVVRPCMSGDRPSASACGFDLPPDPTKAVQPDDAAAKAASYDGLKQAYQQLRLVAGQMWSVYRTGFADPRAAQGDYPYSGYPFTGMGWTYNWDPSAKSHMGVSEFVLPGDTAVTIGSAVDPAAFCNGAVSASAPAAVPAAPPVAAGSSANPPAPATGAPPAAASSLPAAAAPAAVAPPVEAPAANPAPSSAPAPAAVQAPAATPTGSIPTGSVPTGSIPVPKARPNDRRSESAPPASSGR